jgi:hypothetical protein
LTARALSYPLATTSAIPLTNSVRGVTSLLLVVPRLEDVAQDRLWMRPAGACTARCFHRQIGAQGLKLLVMQSLKIVATHTFGSREYRLDAELVLIIGPLFTRGGLVHENPVSASSQVGFHSHHLRLR